MSDLLPRNTLASAYAGKRVLLVGGTGFLGSVTLSLLLQRLPELERLYLVLRRRPGLPAERRFHERILPGVPFEPLRQRFGGEQLAALVESRVRVIEGDITDPLLGVPAETLEEMEGRLDLVINCSGLVDFHAPLERAYRVNILGTQHLLDLCERTGAGLVHTSTAFVAGHRSGRVPERVEPGYYPRAEETPYVPFDPRREIEDLREELDRLEAASRSQRARAAFAEQALTRYREVNDGFPTRSQLDNAVRRAARDHLTAEGVEAGRRRAEFWGWPNVYTYSKAIAEQLISESGVRAAIVRPTIIESAQEYPLPGWNQNATTSAPLVMLALAGFSLLPGASDHVLDLIPVDQVAWSILAVGAATIREHNEPVYQVGTSDSNPLTMRRLADLVGIYTHQRALDEGPGDGGIRRLWKGNREIHLVSEPQFRRRAALVEALSRRVLRESARLRDRVRHRRLRTVLGGLAERAEGFGSETGKAVELWNVFLPFSHDLDYRFETGNLRRLSAEIGEPGEPGRFAPEEIDWRRYWLEIHIPGLRRWVLSEAPPGRIARAASSPVPLIERVESIAARDGYRRALGYGVGARPFALTYGELWSAAGSLAGSLAAREPRTGAVAGVVTRPGEAWPVAMLGALRAGLDVVLVPPDAWAGSFRGEGVKDLDLCIEMPGPAGARLFARGGSAGSSGAELERAPEVALEVERETRVPGNRTGISSSQRSGTVALLSRGPDGWSAGRALSGQELSRELGDLGALLALDDDSRAVLSAPVGDSREAGPLALITLALLQHGARTEVTPPTGIAEVVREVSPTTVILDTEAWRTLEEPGEIARVSTVQRVAVFDEDAATERLQPLNRAGSRVVRITPVAGSASLHAHLLEPAAEEERAEAAPPRRGGALVRADGPPASGDRVLSTIGVGGMRALEGSGRGRRLLVTPLLEGMETVQHLRERIRDDLARHNAAVELSRRVAEVGLTLVPVEHAGGDPAADPRVLWIGAPRAGREHRESEPEILLRDSVALLGGIYDAAELDFFARHLLSEPLTRERLLIWESVLLDGARRGELPAQVFLQSFDSAWARRRHPANRAVRRAGAVVRRAREWARDEDPTVRLLPEPVSAAVRGGIGAATSALFRYGLRTSVYGSAYVPASENFLVVANHSSHLDAGLVQHAIGPWRHRLHTLAAKDYFFSTPARRFVAHHFTRLIPTERQRVSSEWLRRARELLAAGECVLIFPEGTRSAGREVREFKASLGTLVRSAHVPILPIYIEGSEAVLPKGRALPRGRDVRVHVGPPLRPEVVAAATAGIPGLQQDRAIAALLQRAVASVPERDFWWLTTPEEAPDLLASRLALPEPGEPEDSE